MTTEQQEDILDEAKRLTSGDRNNQYGPPDQDFTRTAAMLNALFGHMLKDDCRFESHHVSVIMIALKLSRIMWSPRKRDSWCDIAGYVRCGWQCVMRNMPGVHRDEETGWVTFSDGKRVGGE